MKIGRHENSRKFRALDGKMFLTVTSVFLQIKVAFLVKLEKVHQKMFLTVTSVFLQIRVTFLVKLEKVYQKL